VWGDGIATGEETLASRLRVELERVRPGRFDVVAAGWPGNGLYGYRRAAEVLLPALACDIVVIGWIGRADIQPYDAQAALDTTPTTAPWGWLVKGLRIRQYLFAAWGPLCQGNPQGDRAACTEWEEEQASGIIAAARTNNVDLWVLDYLADGPGPFGAEVRWIHLPKDIRYKGGSDPLWYGLDTHPRPLLNERLAGVIARVFAAEYR